MSEHSSKSTATRKTLLNKKEQLECSAPFLNNLWRRLFLTTGQKINNFWHFLDIFFIRNVLKSIDHYGPRIFRSPWAAQPCDEDMFNKTMEAVGDIVKDDVKLGTLYITLVLASPGKELSQETKVSRIYNMLTVWYILPFLVRPRASECSAGDNITALPLSKV